MFAVKLMTHLSPAALIWQTVFQAPTISLINPIFFFTGHLRQESRLSVLEITNASIAWIPTRIPWHHVKRAASGPLRNHAVENSASVEARE